jgi:hypothetical protein
MLNSVLRNGLCLLLMPVVCSAWQGTATISGRVLNATDGAAVPFASVVIENAASGQQMSGTLAAENGRFVLQGVPPGSYKIRFASGGFYPLDADILISTLNQSYDLGDVRLPRREDLKQEISVTTEAIQGAGTDTQLFRLDEGGWRGAEIRPDPGAVRVVRDRRGHTAARGGWGP